MIIVTIPAYNEEETIGEVIRRVPRKIGRERVKVIVIDDGSRDETVAVAKKAGADKIVSHVRNRGVGAAFRTGVRTALEMNADIMVNIDADLQFGPEDIPKLVEPILSGEADMVTCSRFLDPSLEVEPKMPWVKRLGNKLFTGIVNWLAGKKFTDTQCGFRAYSREALLRLSLFGDYTYTQEVFLDLLNKGMRIVEVPCKVRGKRNGKSRLIKHWYTYGLKSLYIIMKTIRDQQPMKFFGAIGLTVFLVGVFSGVFLLTRWFATGQITPYRSLIDLMMLTVIVGFLLIILALIADMLDRQRKLLEEIVYRQKVKK